MAKSTRKNITKNDFEIIRRMLVDARPFVMLAISDSKNPITRQLALDKLLLAHKRMMLTYDRVGRELK